MTSIVKLENISKFFQRGVFRRIIVKAVSNVSFEVEEGEVLNIVGESGSGKTTLGRITVGLIKPSTGKVFWKNIDIWGPQRKEALKMRTKMQYIHQDPYSSLNPAKTVYQILGRLVIKHRIASSRSDALQKVRELLEFVGITPPEYFLNKYPHHLSGGMRQRLAFARALIPRPYLIVADEPVSMIDVSLKLGIINLIKKINREYGTSFIVITHELPVAKILGGRTMVMYLGHVIEHGKTEELFTNPLHPYLRELILATPVPDPRIARKMIHQVRAREALEVAISGCPFYLRCPYRKEICRARFPELMEVRKGHHVACHLANELPEWIPPWRS